MSAEMKQTIYTVGGTVQAGGGAYLSRQADDELLNLCRRSTFAYILTARQMGKSSLMVRTANQLAKESVRSVIIDLAQIGTQVTPEQWYLGLLAIIEEQLALSTDAVAWWQANAHLGFTQRLTKFFEEVLPKEIAEPVVVFVDEIDTTLSLGFTDDFYAAIRYLYNARATTPEFKRLSFVLIGVATPGDLIRDPQRTPFNIGQRVDLADFAFAEVMPLANGFNFPPDEAKQVLSWVMKWTNGHPYLTQRLCIALSDQSHNHWAEADVDRVVADTFFGAMSEQDNNLQFVRDMLTKRAPDVEGVLTTYREVRSDKHPVRDEEQSLVKSHLKLSGVVRREQAGLRMRNPIYAAVFDERWIKQHLRIDLVKRFKRASIKLAPYVAVALLILSLYAWWTVWTLTAKAVDAESRGRKAEAAKQDAEAALKQAKEETTRFNEMVWTAKNEAEAARDEAEAAKKDAERSRKEAESQVRDAIAAASRRRQEAERQASVAQKEANELQKAAISARDAIDEARRQLKIAEEAKANAEMAEADAKRAAAQALNLAKEAEDRLKAANEAIEGTNKLQRAQDEKAKKEGFAKAVFRFHTGPVTSVAINPQDSKLVVTASEDGTARVVDVYGDVDEKRVKQTLKSQSAVNSAVFSSDGQSVVTASVDGKIRVYDAKTGKERTDLPGHIGVTPLKAVQQWSKEGLPIGTSSAIPLNTNSRFVAMEGSEAGTVQVWDLTDMNKGPVTLKGPQDKLSSLAVSPIGQFIVAVYENNSIQVWRRTKSDDVFEMFADLPGHQAPITSLAFSPDENLLATAGKDNAARIWSLIEPGNKPVAAERHGKPLTSIAFSPSGKWVVTASEDGRTRVWNAENGKSIVELRKRTFLSIVRAQHRRFPLKYLLPVSIDFYSKGELPGVNSASFSPDGNYVVTASEDGTAQIWKAETGKNVATLSGHILAVRSAVFTPDGLSVITAGADNTVRVWDLCGGKVKLRASDLRERCLSLPSK